ncbi:PHB depolymerase family esterase [uncultured Ruminococcus sp.]|uniref:alpha/beta hydrolase family esterase n=1 Tax=uncultured Ruminococcus sp. TaxID=165186 RepID=UPI002623043C|nr:PHB depolymerase family esterase [uncultured Ruminococcus sp.]
MKKVFALIEVLLVTFCLIGCAVRRAPSPPPVLEDIIEADGLVTSCTFDGVQHDIITDLPENTQNAPLVVMLHGYGDTADNFRNSVRFHERANEEGYAVVYVTGACDPDDRTSSNCWTSWDDGTGNDDLGFLRALAKHLQERYGLDPGRTYAVGFSNGAFMAHRLAAQAGDTYSAVVSVSGMMQQSVWKKRPETNNAGVFQLTGEKDDVVPKKSDGSADHVSAPAIEDVMSYWAESDGLELTEISEIGKGSQLKKYTGSSGRQVWDLFIKDGRHTWKWSDNDINGIDTTELILEFLDAQS